MGSWSRSLPSYHVPLFQNEASYKNKFDLHENKHGGRTHFHLNGFARRLVLKKRQKPTAKLP